MKRLLFLWLGLGFLILPARASAEEIIRDFSVRATLSADRTLKVTEQIIYDFGAVEKHGFYRVIPNKYLRNGATYNLRLKNVTVVQDGIKVQPDISEQNGELWVKVGEADKTVNGIHTYEISYQTNRAINFFEDHSELYWNVTGDKWEIPIEQASFDLNFSGLNLTQRPNAQCFTGVLGSTEASCSIEASVESTNFDSLRFLNPYEGLTVVVGLPFGTLKAPTWLERISAILLDNLVLAVPLLALVIMHSLWWTRGRDPKLGTVIPLYAAPNGLKPGELAAAREDGALSNRGVTAMIIDLARRGYLHVRYAEEASFIGQKQTFSLIKIKPADELLSSDERAILNGLFKNSDETNVKDLATNKFYEDIKIAKEDIWKRLDEQNIFDKRPATVRVKYFLIGFAITFVLMFFAGSAPLVVPAVIATDIIIGIYGWFMPRRTLKGARLLADIKGFEWFMNVTEKERLNFHNAPERTPEQFQALLPFAIALGVEQAWAKQFAGMDLQSPTWAEGAGWRAMNASAFVSSLDSLHDQASAAGYSAPSSSAGGGGSGFSGGGSGGGFGGGGGGSW